jgi:hypothetical protein
MGIRRRFGRRGVGGIVKVLCEEGAVDEDKVDGEVGLKGELVGKKAAYEIGYVACRFTQRS